MRFLLKLILIILIGTVILGAIRRYERNHPAAPEPTTNTEETVANFSIGAGEYVRDLPSERKYLLYVPKSYKPDTATPLVLFYHGGGGGMRQASNAYGWKEKSEKEGFIVAFTNGTSKNALGVFATWNAGSCCDYARDNNVDDIKYTKDVLEDIKKDFNIQKNAVFGTGFSNGGMLMHKIACDAPELFTALAAVSGTDGTKTCTPSKQLPLMHIHAIDDTHVLFNGGAGDDAFRDLSKVTEFTSVPDTLALWIKRYGLSPTPTRVLANEGAYCDLYTGSGEGSFTLCVTPDGKHSWPDAKDPSHSGAIPTKTINGDDVVWDFFKSHIE